MIQEQTPFIQIVFEELEEYGLYDQKLKLYNFLEAAMYGQAGKARKEIDALVARDSGLQGTVSYSAR